MDRTTKRLRLGLIAVAGVALVFLVVLCDGDSRTISLNPSGSLPAGPPGTEDELGGSLLETSYAQVAARLFVKEELDLPATAEFHNPRSPDSAHPLRPYRNRVVYLGNARYQVSGSVSRESSLGGKHWNEYDAVVRAKRDERNTWVLESLEIW